MLRNKINRNHESQKNHIKLAVRTADEVPSLALNDLKVRPIVKISGALDVATPLSVRASYDYTNGTDRVSGRPLPLMPPPRTIVGGELHSTSLRWADRVSIGAEVENHKTQTRLGDFDVQTEGYTLLNLDVRMDRVVRARPFRFDIDVRNATNVAYKDFLSRYKGFASAPGINVILKASAGAW